MERGKIKNYFPGGNTSKGFFSFYQYIPYNVDQVYIIKGGPGTGKSTFMKRIGNRAINEGYDIEFHWCSSDNESLDGLVIPDKNIAIFDGTAPHMIDPVYPGAYEEIINLGIFWDSQKLKQHEEEITELSKVISEKFNLVYHYLKIAKLVHDEWETYYQKGFDINKANQITDKLIHEIITDDKVVEKGQERHLFGSAFTPNGTVDYFDELTGDVDKRYIVKGRPGTGKSTMTKKIADRVLKNGYDVLFLHCSFDPDSVDTIIIPELSVALIDGTAPHIVDPERENDQLVDMLECVDQEKTELYLNDIEEVKQLYQRVMSRANSKLKEAKAAHDELEEYYIDAMNFGKVEAVRRELESQLF